VRRLVARTVAIRKRRYFGFIFIYKVSHWNFYYFWQSIFFRQSICKMDMGIVSVRMDKETKEKFTDFCKSVGITVSAAVNMFARMTIQENRLPFDVKRFPKQ
jgi:DNA-damage-inducible protein J